jgi:hypothetical protein
VSIEGGRHRWLREALERRDLPLVKATAAQLPAVDLATALEIALVTRLFVRKDTVTRKGRLARRRNRPRGEDVVGEYVGGWRLSIVKTFGALDRTRRMRAGRRPRARLGAVTPSD